MNCQVKATYERRLHFSKLRVTFGIKNLWILRFKKEPTERNEGKKVNQRNKKEPTEPAKWWKDIQPPGTPIASNHPTIPEKEVEILKRLRELESEAKDERIAILEREIAEDKHIHALKVRVWSLPPQAGCWPLGTTIGNFHM